MCRSREGRRWVDDATSVVMIDETRSRTLGSTAEVVPAGWPLGSSGAVVAAGVAAPISGDADALVSAGEKMELMLMFSGVPQPVDSRQEIGTVGADVRDGDAASRARAGGAAVLRPRGSDVADKPGVTGDAGATPFVLAASSSRAK